jgi:hypothetical protein
VRNHWHYAFSSEREKEVMLNRNFKRVNAATDTHFL